MHLSAAPRSALPDVLLDRHVVYRSVVGSRAWGLAHEGSDTDRRGVYLAPASLQWSLAGAPASLQRSPEEAYWELQHCLVLALKANPTVLECLASPLVELATPVGQELRALLPAFLSRRASATFRGYVDSQFRKLQRDLGLRGAPRWKHAMHLLRLLLTGERLLREGVLHLDVSRHRDQLLAVRAGELGWEEVDAWRQAAAGGLRRGAPGQPVARGAGRRPRRRVPRRFPAAGGPGDGTGVVMRELETLRGVVAAQRAPLLFASVSGAHLYGFASPDSDWDLRGVHVLPPEEVVGLRHGAETRTVCELVEGLDLDLVTHDVAKFCRLLLRRNGYVLEQLYSPLVVVGGAGHDELRALAHGCVTRNHIHHYAGFARNEWSRFERGGHRDLKALLYVLRVLKTGVHLMRTGDVVADLPSMLDEPPVVPGIAELVARKREGGERTQLEPGEGASWSTSVVTLQRALEEAAATSALPRRAVRGRCAARLRR